MNFYFHKIEPSVGEVLTPRHLSQWSNAEQNACFSGRNILTITTALVVLAFSVTFNSLLSPSNSTFHHSVAPLGELSFSFSPSLPTTLPPSSLPSSLETWKRALGSCCSKGWMLSCVEISITKQNKPLFFLNLPLLKFSGARRTQS